MTNLQEPVVILKKYSHIIYRHYNLKLIFIFKQRSTKNIHSSDVRHEDIQLTQFEKLTSYHKKREIR